MKQTLETLQQFLQNKDTDLSNKATLLLARHTRVSDDFNAGILDYNDRTRELNRINAALLALQEEVRKAFPSFSEDKGTPQYKAEKTTEKKGGISVFFSYAHKDKDLRDRLDVFLSPLKRSKKIDTWHDKAILAGESWDDEIKGHLENADVVLLLVSADFLASDYCNYEIEVAMQRRSAGLAKALPIILKPCAWKITELAKVQALPEGGKPITQWDNMDEALLSVVEGIQKVMDSFGK